jgi:hypothetical protein
LQAATSLEFGAVEPDAPLSSSVRQPKPLRLVEAPSTSLVRRRASVIDHLAFLLALVFGGTLAVLTSGGAESPAMTTLETAFAGRSWLVAVVLAILPWSSCYRSGGAQPASATECGHHIL